MWALVRRGKKMAGGALVYPEFFVEETTGGAYYGAQLLNTALQDVVQPAEQQWRFYYEAVVLPYTDIILGRGGYAGVDIVRQKFQTAAGSFMQKLARALYGTSPQNTSLDIDNIDRITSRTSWPRSTACSRPARRDLSDVQRERLERVRVELDRYWDLLRQRRAREEFGMDPDFVELRDEKTVEGFEQ